MRNLIVKGDFEETSNSCNGFMEQLISHLKDDNNDYFKIKLTDNYRGEVYGHRHKPIFDKLTKWVSSLKDINDDNILQDLEDNFKDENIISYMKESIERRRDMDLAPHLEDLRLDYLLKDVENIEEMSEYDDAIIKTYKFTAHKDLCISDTSDNFSLEIKVLKSYDNINTNRIEEMLCHFANGTGEFTVTSIMDEDTMEFLDIDEIFECPHFETECFGSDAGYEEISIYLNEQLPDGFEINELEINYIKNR